MASKRKRQVLNIEQKLEMCNLKSVRVHFAYGSDGRSFYVEYS